jgi:hypothetical protein
VSKRTKPDDATPPRFAAAGGDVRFKFADGTTAVLSIAEARALRDRQIQRMIDSDDVEVHLAGLKARQDYADIEAAHAHAEADHAEKLLHDDTRAANLDKATKGRTKLPDRIALLAEMDAIRAKTGCSPIAAKAKLQARYGVTRQGLNKRLRPT